MMYGIPQSADAASVEPTLHRSKTRDPEYVSGGIQYQRMHVLPRSEFPSWSRNGDVQGEIGWYSEDGDQFAGL